MPSTIIPAAKLAASKAFLSEIIKDMEESGITDNNTCTPTPIPITPLATPPTTPEVIRSTNMTSGHCLPTPPPSPPDPAAGSPTTVDDNPEFEVKIIHIGIAKKNRKDKDKATDVTEKDSQNHGPPTPTLTPEPEPEPELTSPPKPTHVHSRKLVTVRRISAIDTATNKYHTKLTIDGWTIGVNKRPRPSKVNFETGHRVIFLEPDTLLPADQPRYSKLFAQVGGNPITYDGRKWFRVGTRTVGPPRCRRWQFVSQGHVFHLKDFPEVHDDVMLKARLARFGGGCGGDGGGDGEEQELVDYSALLGAVKWDPYGDLPTSWSLLSSVPCLSKNKNSIHNGGKGGNSSKKNSPPAPIVKKPSWIQKTDIERVQNCPNLFKKPKYKNIVFQESVKVDGTSMTCYFVPKQSKYFKQLHEPHPGAESVAHSVFESGRFGVTSKHVDLPFSEDCPYWAAAVKNNIGALLEDLHKNGHRGALAIQGEVVGPTISGNHYGLPPTSAPSFTVYSVWNIETQYRWDPRTVQKFCSTHGLSHVEVLGYHKVTGIASSHEDMIARASSRQGEGLVFKSCASDGRWFKVLSDRWITERGDEVDAQLEEAITERGDEVNAQLEEAEAVQATNIKVSAKHTSSVSEDTTLPKTSDNGFLDNVKAYLDAPVTWLGQPMSHREAIGEIGRIILAEMAINKNMQGAIKDLVEVVLDELKFVQVETDKTFAGEEMESEFKKDDVPVEVTPDSTTTICNSPETPTSLDTPTSPETPTSLDTPTSPNTPASLDTPTSPETPTSLDTPTSPNAPASLDTPTSPDTPTTSHEINPSTEPIVSVIATEHDNGDNGDNESAGVNWDDYKVFKQGGKMVCIRREDYRPRSPPCMYASAEEMVRRREARHRDRQRRYRFLGE